MKSDAPAVPLDHAALRLDGALPSCDGTSVAAALSAPPVSVQRTERGARVILSFDVEEHHKIEAAAGLQIGAAQQAYYRGRVGLATRWLLELLEEKGILATFFVVGEIAQEDRSLIRAISRSGHEVASHSWDHRRLHCHTPESFREDVQRSKDTLEGITGLPVVGYRAPTFSLLPQTAWAIDILAELGMAYDSSIYPVYHDRYGVPNAPRAPFVALGSRFNLLEVPPATLRVLGINVPTGGGGYFRLLPTYLVRKTIEQVSHRCRPAVAMLYFHPWEFDPEQVRLPLGLLSRMRTYVGLRRNRKRLSDFLDLYQFERACDVAKRLNWCLAELPMYRLADQAIT
jgi:polysaccharide deacetylase family protein (PEP-CTERM system associated)